MHPAEVHKQRRPHRTGCLRRPQKTPGEAEVQLEFLTQLLSTDDLPVAELWPLYSHLQAYSYHGPKDSSVG